MATPAFRTAFGATTRSLVVLAKIEPRDPTTLASSAPVYLSTAVCVTPAGSVEPARAWSPLIESVGSISAPGAFLSTDLGLCTMDLTIAKSAIPPELLLDGAAVTVFQWETSLASFDEANLVFPGVVLSWREDGMRLALSLRQRTNWNRDLVPVEVTAEAFPHAPQDSLGQVVPIVYGKHSDDPFRAPWPERPQMEDVTTFPTVYRGASLFFGGRRAGPAILVDTGRGAGAVTNPKAKVLVASHKVRKVADLLNGCGVYMKNGDSLVSLDPVDPVNDVINTATEAGMLIPDNTSLAWVGAYPVDVDVVANSAENPRAVLDPFNDENFAKFDWTAGYRTLRMKMPSLDDLGEMVGVYLLCGYRSIANTNLKLRFRNTTTSTVVDGSLAISATHRIVMGRLGTVWGGALPGTPWAFSEMELEAGWPTSTPVITGTGTAEVYFAGFLVNFKPRQETIESEKLFEHQATRPVARHFGGPRGGRDVTIWQTYTARETVPAIQELVGKFFANVEGYGDDGEVAAAGTFTGTADALIERPPDVLAHILAKYGAESLANVETAPGVFGSFADARANLLTASGRDMVLALAVGQTSDVMTAISWIAQASASLVILDRFTDRWRFVPWRPDAPTDYDLVFRPTDLVEKTSLEVESTPLSRAISGLSLGYGYDAARRGFRHRTRLAWDGSDAGFKYRNIRDEYLSVVAGVNDRLDFATSGLRTANLTVGDYDGPSYGVMVAGAMKTADPTRDFCVAHGFTIVQNFNDRIAFQNALTLTTYTVDVAPGVYTADEACAVIVAAMAPHLPGSPATATFSRSTRKVSIGRPTGGTGSLVLYVDSSDARARRLYATLGYKNVTARTCGGATFAEADYERDDDTFSVACTGLSLDLLWETGANGLKGTKRNCAAALGFSTLRDQLAGGNVWSWLGASPKGNREQALRTTASRYGARRDTVEDLRAVADTDTAREVRNRIATLLGKPRLTVRFSSDRVCDLERGRVIEFSGDFDAVVKYRNPDSDGTWAGKRFVVVETEQLLGPAAFYMKVRAVSLD